MRTSLVSENTEVASKGLKGNDIKEDSKQEGTTESLRQGGTIKAQKIKSIEEEDKNKEISAEPP